MNPVLYCHLLPRSCLGRACKMAEGRGSSFLLPMEYRAGLWGSEWSISHNPPTKILWPPHRGVRGVGGICNQPPLLISHFMGGSEFLKILGVQGIIIMWQLVFASCHRLVLASIP